MPPCALALAGRKRRHPGVRQGSERGSTARRPRPLSEVAALQHHPEVSDGKEVLIEYFERMPRDYAGKHVKFTRAIAGDNYVVLQCYQTWPGDHDYAEIDIVRFDRADAARTGSDTSGRR